MAEDKEDSKGIKFLKPVFEGGSDKGANPWAVLLFILILIGLVSVVVSPAGLSTTYSIGSISPSIMQILSLLVVIYLAVLVLNVIGGPAKGALKAIDEIVAPGGGSYHSTSTAGQRPSPEHVAAKSVAAEPEKNLIVYADPAAVKEGKTTNIHAIAYQNGARKAGVLVEFKVLGSGTFIESTKSNAKLATAKTKKNGDCNVEFKMGSDDLITINVLAAGYPPHTLLIGSTQSKRKIKGEAREEIEAHQNKTAQERKILITESEPDTENDLNDIDDIFGEIDGDIDEIFGEIDGGEDGGDE
ncbi:hypothetical protein ACFLQI_00360 [Candidatus Undinarchaeota archaeon]